MKNILPIALALLIVACAPIATNDTNNTTPILPVPTGEVSSIDASQVKDTGKETSGKSGKEGDAAVKEETPANEDFAARLTFTEGDLIRLKTLAVDPDNDKVTLEFSEPFDKEGMWQTRVGDAGDYPVTVRAKDSKGAATAQRILVTVGYANRPPEIIGPDSIGVKEGETVLLEFTAKDPDNTEAIISYSGWMKGSTYKTTYEDAGEHEVTVTAEDGKSISKKTVKINVENVNRAPEIELGRSSYTVVELQEVVVKADAEDPDGDEVTLSFGAPLDSKGRWTPALDEAGSYTATVTASDGVDEAKVDVDIEVTSANRAPTVSVPTEEGVLRFKEGDEIDLRTALLVEDREGEEVAVRYSGWMRTAVYQTTYEDAGEHEVTVEANDDSGHLTKATVTIIVEDVNRPPVFVQPA